MIKPDKYLGYPLMLAFKNSLMESMWPLVRGSVSSPLWRSLQDLLWVQLLANLLDETINMSVDNWRGK